MNRLNEEQAERLQHFFAMTDEEFYEKYVSGASLEEQAAFLNEFPDFLEDAPMEEKGDLEKDETYQQILQQVR